MLHTGKKTVILSNSVVSFISQFSIMVVNIENIFGVKKIFGTDLQLNKKKKNCANIRGCFVCSVLDVDEV
jgi:hypothetical protein